MSTFLVLHTPVTSAPNALAIWMANVPTPPDAPLIRTFWPGSTLPSSRSSWRAVVADTPTAAACSKVRLAGFGNEVVLARARVLRERAGAPAEDLIARSKLRHVLADRLDRPRDIRPGTRFFGLRSPVATRMTSGTPVIEEPVPDMD